MIVKLPPNEYVDLYAATGFTVGNVLAVTNVSGSDVKLFSTASTPSVDSDFFPCLFHHNTVNNTSGDVGAWAQCIGLGAVDVKEVV